MIDQAVPPQLKYSPKRSVIVLGIFLLFFFILLPVVFWGEKVLAREKQENPLQEKEFSLFSRVKKFYKLKI
jgi:uncharacterized protein involved in exopolysaccharide biosynthesis